MHRLMRALLALFFTIVIIISAIVLMRHFMGAWRADLTEQKLYTLSGGSKAILARLNQPVTLKLYYAKTAAMKAPDMIRDYNNYAQFVEELLGEYVRAANGNIKLEVIDPRPFSQDEEDALKYRLQRHQITEEESFFFGLVVQTPFGVTKSIPFFAPDRKAFVEYDVSQLIDSAVRRQKQRIGVLSSLPVMGEDQTSYMAQMKRMQGQPLQEPWIFIQQLRQRYEVNEIKTDVEEINPEDVDVLLVIHPKEFSESTLFAIDQYLMKDGKIIVCVDPHAWVDQPDRMAQMSGQMPSSSSNMPILLKTWGLEMKDDIFAGDRSLAITTSLSQNQRPGLVIGFLDLKPDMGCFNQESVITASLNDVVVMMAGALRRMEVSASSDEKGNSVEEAAAKEALAYLPLWQTSNRGNTWSVSGPYELMMPNPARWLEQFSEGNEPVVMSYLVTGKFQSAFPNGIDVEVKTEENSETPDNGTEDTTKEEKPKTKHLAGLTEVQEPGVVAVFADVDFISDMLAYQRTFFGAAARGDNAACLMNAVDSMAGSSDLIQIRSRGGFQRPFKKVDEIEAVAAKENEAELEKINAEIEGLQKELNEMASKAKSIQDIIAGAEKLQETRDIELKIHEAEMRRREVQLRKNEDIEALKSRLMWLNIASAPVGVLLIALILAVVRYTRRRSYISHSSDA
ncbi:MAG: Gldg family protein [Sedimentisphaerales bacterium]|nr:Gldg family protein [Sedimentisphaerales bacterium]